MGFFLLKKCHDKTTKQYKRNNHINGASNNKILVFRDENSIFKIGFVEMKFFFNMNFFSFRNSNL